MWCGFANTTPYDVTPVLPLTGTTTFLRHPIAHLLLARVARSTQGGPKTFPSFGRLASLGSIWTFFRGYGNINPLSIDYACRPRLRSRLTLGGLAWPRNPWSFGGGVSHSSFATHACILTRVPSTTGLPRRFIRHTTLPYPSMHLAGNARLPADVNMNASASVVYLSPVTLSAQNHLTSELLRTL